MSQTHHDTNRCWRSRRPSLPPLDLYGPIAADLEEVERILARRH